jgi:hypothetical protein
VHRSNLAIASLGVLVGIAILILSVINQKEMQVEDSQLAQIKKAVGIKTTGIPPEDSPVLVRGGSAESFAEVQWQPQGTPGVWEISPVNTTSVSLDGVSTTIGGTPNPESASSLSNNWSMTLTFRKKDQSEDTKYQLMLCTSYPCSSTGPLSNTLYVIDVNNNGNFDCSAGSPCPEFDNLYRLKYEVPDCGDGTQDIRCKRIKKIAVDGIKFSSGDTPPFYCRAGACDIGVNQ